MREKKAIEIGFNWIFAVIAGGFILFFAIYSASKFINISEKSISTKTALSFPSFIDHLETGLASGRSSPLASFRKDVLMDFSCDNDMNQPFGQQKIIYTEKYISDRYGQSSEPVAIKDKYIFVHDSIEGREFRVFSKPFFLPFKIADIIVILEENTKHCMYKAPENVVDDLTGLAISNVYFTSDINNCSSDRIICFGSQPRSAYCDVQVIGMCLDPGCNDVYDYGRVLQDNTQVYFSGNLVYAAIFSSSDIYECNVKRLMNRCAELSDVYIDKIKVIKRKGCEPKLQHKLELLKIKAKSVQGSKDIIDLHKDSEIIEKANDETNSICRIY